MIVAAAAAPALVRYGDLGTVDVTINGKGPYHFILDTGAGITIITPEFARSAGLHGDSSGVTEGAGGSVGMQVVSIADVRCGSADARDVRAAVVPLPPDVTYQGRKGTIDGILGYTFWSHFATTFDARKHTVTFSDPTAFVADPKSVSVDASFDGYVPTVTAAADGITGRFQIDTGSNGSLQLTTAFVNAHALLAKYPHGIVTVTQGVGGATHSETVRLASFTIAGTTIPRPVGELYQTKKGVLDGSRFDGNVGTEILNRFIFTVEPARGRIDFTPQADARAVRPYLRTGLQLTREADGTMNVAAIQTGSPGAAAHVVPGDRVVDINGVAAGTLSGAEVAHALHAPSVRLTIEAKGVRRDVTLKAVDLLSTNE